MAILASNARRIRRKLFSRDSYRIALFVILCFILLYIYLRRAEIPDELVILSQYTTNIDDPSINWNRVAHVQYVVTPDELCKAVMLFSQLKEVSSLVARVLMYPSDWRLNASTNNGDVDSLESHVARVLRYAADEFTVILRPVDALRGGASQTIWRQPFTKFLAYNLTEYDRVVVLGGESIVVRPLDDLFFLPPVPLAMPYVYWSKPGGWRFSNQIMVMKPSAAYFSQMERVVKNAGADETEMGVAFSAYNDTIMRLPQRPFHILTEEFRKRGKEHARYLGSYEEQWNADQILRETRLVHYFDPLIPDPWNGHLATWKRYAPRCVPTTYRRFSCVDRDTWTKYYTDYEFRKKNVCGAGFS